MEFTVCWKQILVTLAHQSLLNKVGGFGEILLPHVNKLNAINTTLEGVHEYSEHQISTVYSREVSKIYTFYGYKM